MWWHWVTRTTRMWGLCFACSDGSRVFRAAVDSDVGIWVCSLVRDSKTLYFVDCGIVRKSLSISVVCVCWSRSAYAYVCLHKSFWSTMPNCCSALLFFPLTHPCQCLPLFFFFFRMWESCHTFCSVLIYGTGHLTTAPRSSNISGFWEPGVCFLSVCVGHSFTLHSVLLRVNKNKWKGMETGGILWGHPA